MIDIVYMHSRLERVERFQRKLLQCGSSVIAGWGLDNYSDEMK